MTGRALRLAVAGMILAGAAFAAETSPTPLPNPLAGGAGEAVPATAASDPAPDLPLTPPPNPRRTEAAPPPAGAKTEEAQGEGNAAPEATPDTANSAETAVEAPTGLARDAAAAPDRREAQAFPPPAAGLVVPPPNPLRTAPSAAGPEQVAPVVETVPEAPASPPSAAPVAAPESALAALSAPRPATRPRAPPPARARAPSSADDEPETAPGADAPPAGGVEDGRLALRRILLLGIYEDDSGRRALVRLPDGTVARVRERDMVAGWRVQRIGPRDLNLRGGDANQRLTLP